MNKLKRGIVEMDIEKLQLTIRNDNALKAANITTVEELINLSFDELNDIKNIGKNSVLEIVWMCNQVLNGKFLERCIEYEGLCKRDEDNNLAIDKAKEYDEIKLFMRRKLLK